MQRSTQNSPFQHLFVGYRFLVLFLVKSPAQLLLILTPHSWILLNIVASLIPTHPHFTYTLSYNVTYHHLIWNSYLCALECEGGCPLLNWFFIGTTHTPIHAWSISCMALSKYITCGAYTRAIVACTCGEVPGDSHFSVSYSMGLEE